MSLCLFCAVPTPTPSEDGIHSSLVLTFLEEEEDQDVQIVEQLKVIFILRNILKIPEENLSQFLYKNDGQLHPESWMKVCHSCEETVVKYYETLKQLLKLQRKLLLHENELKNLIQKTRHDCGGTGEDGQANSIWKEVREHVLADMRENRAPESDVEMGVEQIIPEDTRSIPPQVPVAGQMEDSGQPIYNEVREGVDLSSSCESNILVGAAEENGACELERGNAGAEALRHAANSSGGDHGQLRITRSSRNGCDGLLSTSADSAAHSSEKEHQPIPVNEKPSSEEEEPEAPRYYSTFENKGKTWFKCLKCPYNTKYRPRMNEHSELHEANSGTIVCSVCDWLVDSKLKARHDANYHQERLTYTLVKTGTDRVYSCAKCPYKVNTHPRIKSHVLLHLPDAVADLCYLCGCLVYPNKVNRHIAVKHPGSRNSKKGSK